MRFRCMKSPATCFLGRPITRAVVLFLVVSNNPIQGFSPRLLTKITRSSISGTMEDPLVEVTELFASCTTGDSESIQDYHNERIGNNEHNETSNVSKVNHKSAKKKEKVALKKEWLKVVDRFSSQVLHESFLDLPVRSTTIKAAEAYMPGTLSNFGQECLMPGSHKHLGGAYDPTDGCIYGVPANARSVMCLYPTTTTLDDGTEYHHYKMKTIPLPKSIQECRFKWLRGIFAHGYLWAIPSWANRVLCVNVDAYWGRTGLPPGEDIVTLIPLPDDYPKDDGMKWQWHGAGINQEKTAIYCIPSNAQAVLKVNLQTKTTSLIHVDIKGREAKYPNFNIQQANKWYGGIVGHDNAVYGIPYRSCAVLRIDCNTDTATLVGKDYDTAKYNWHGGIQVNGKIYAHPSHAHTVLVIDTTKGDHDNEYCHCYELPIHKASYDTDGRQNYKWLGGSVGSDGNIYCPACDTSAVLKIDTSTDHCTTFGFAGKEKNKWQGGILSSRDECIYCIPASGRHILRIATSPSIHKGKKENPIQLLGELPAHQDKWQGGYVGKDGALYFVPENGYRVLKVTPPLTPPKYDEQKISLPSNDVQIEML